MTICVSVSHHAACLMDGDVHAGHLPVTLHLLHVASVQPDFISLFYCPFQVSFFELFLGSAVVSLGLEASSQNCLAPL